MTPFDALESQSIYILREAHSRIDRLAMLWSLGKDSNVMVWLARKAFFGHVTFPVMYVDTGRWCRSADLLGRPLFAPVSAATGKERGQRSASSARAAKATCEIFATSHPNFGTSSAPTCRPAVICAYTRCFTGPG
jgi:hypothetical protein